MVDRIKDEEESAFASSKSLSHSPPPNKNLNLSNSASEITQLTELVRQLLVNQSARGSLDLAQESANWADKAARDNVKVYNRENNVAIIENLSNSS
jgi:hypothetical protein